MIAGEVFEHEGVRYFADNAAVKNGMSCCHRLIRSESNRVWEAQPCAFKQAHHCPDVDVFPCGSTKLYNNKMTSGFVAVKCYADT